MSTGAAAIYLEQIRAQLSDLPPGELEDVLQDVSGHLSEVAAEFGTEPTTADLQARLGTPEQYADQLRTAAGYPPRQPQKDDLDAGWNALRWGLIAATVGPFFVAVAIFAWSRTETSFFGLLGFGVLFVAAFFGVLALHGKHPRVVLQTAHGARAATAIRGWIDQIPPNVRHELVTIGQPIWWVARGMIGAGGFFALFGAPAVTVVGALAGAVVSIWIGRRTQQDGRWLWYVVPLNVVAAIAVPAFLAAAYMGASFGFLDTYGTRHGGSAYNPPDNGLRLNGTPISNVYPFDAQGKQVSVRLYDDDGNPIDLELQDCAAVYGQARREGTSNLFPQPVIVPDENGVVTDEENCKDTTKAPFTPPPVPATTPTQTPPTPAPPTVTPKPTKPSIPHGTPTATLPVKPTR
ncbi:HAAS signaling domain-containing protein [Kribbella sp. NPDC048928]|uniref:HAAS signaling domain-containing protein n=1 Tax=Kribbella sp. NPDC048928 TaxID=3364111 RepID=UPI0037189D11